jgi:hypothetical protein
MPFEGDEMPGYDPLTTEKTALLQPGFPLTYTLSEMTLLNICAGQ